MSQIGLKTIAILSVFILFSHFTKPAGAGCVFPTITEYTKLPIPMALQATGENSYYQLGDGTNIDRNQWVRIYLPKEILSIHTSRGNSFVITTDNELWGVGPNDRGQLGLGHNDTITQWTKLADNAVKVAGGSLFTVYLAQNGKVYSTGSNDYGQLGTHNNIDYNTWQEIANNGKDIATGVYHTLITKTDNNLYGCGYNQHYELGQLNQLNYNFLVHIYSDVDFAKGGGYHSLILLTDGSLYGCGYNLLGQLGKSGSGYTYLRRPLFITNLVTNMDCGFWHSIISRNGDLWATGYNDNGALGVGYFGSTSSHSFQPLGNNFVDDGKAARIACGDHHTIVLTNEGKVYACGINGSGQINNGDNISRHTLTLTRNNVDLISASGNHTLVFGEE